MPSAGIASFEQQLERRKGIYGQPKNMVFCIFSGVREVEFLLVDIQFDWQLNVLKLWLYSLFINIKIFSHKIVLKGKQQQVILKLHPIFLIFDSNLGILTLAVCERFVQLLNLLDVNKWNWQIIFV